MISKTHIQPPASQSSATGHTSVSNISPTSERTMNAQVSVPVMTGSTPSGSILSPLKRDTLQSDIAHREAQGLPPLPKHDLQRQIIDRQLQAKEEGIAPGDNSLKRQISKEEWQGVRAVVNAVTSTIAVTEMISPSTLPSASDSGRLGVSLPGHVRIPIPPTQAEDLHEAAKERMNERSET